MTSPEEIYEIQVRRVEELSSEAREEVLRKLSTKPKEFLTKYRGFASITYVSASPLRVKSVDPIEGEFRDLFASVLAQLKTARTTAQ